MNICELYKQSFNQGLTVIKDYLLVHFTEDVLVGIDKVGNCSFVINSSTPKQTQICQCTKVLSLECNVNATYSSDGKTTSTIVHVLKCLSKDEEDISLFLELSSLFINEGDYSEEYIFGVFRTMVNFFSDKNEPSDIELQGLFAELYTIKYFMQPLHLENYWQSKDKLKFDFSISDKLKIEVKSTLKNNRIHHFKHDQLMTNLYDIFVVSFMLKHDDLGLSLYDLLLEARYLFRSDVNRLIKINQVLRNTSKSRLCSMCFEENYTNLKMKIFKAEEIPKFRQVSPEGVSNAEYDCNLENINEVNFDDFIEKVLLEFDER